MHPLPRRFHRATITVAVALAVASTWPIARHPVDHVIDGSALVAPVGEATFWSYNIGADVITTVWIVNWFLRAVVTQPFALFAANTFYPFPLAGALQEHLFATDLLGAPGALLVGPVFAHQTALLLCVALNAWSAAYVVARWTGSLLGGLVAGGLFAVSPFHQIQLFHLQSLGTFYLPLLLLGLERFGATGALRWAGLVAGALAAQILSGQYVGYMAMVTALVAATIVLLAGRPARRPLARLARDVAWLGGAALLSALVTLPFVLPYFQLLASGDIPDNAHRAVNSLLGLGEYLPHARAPAETVRLGGLGIGTWVLAAVGAVALARNRVSRVRLLVLVAVAGVGALISLGPQDSWIAPWRSLSAVIPGFGAMREPFRFSLLPCLGAALLAGCGAAAMTRPGTARVVGTVAALALCGWSMAHAWYGPLPLRPVAVGASVPEEYRVLARCGDGDPLVELPMPVAVLSFRDAEPQLMSVHHWLPLLNGRASYAPPDMARIRLLTGDALLTPEGLAELRRLTGVRWVLAHCAKLAPPQLRQALCTGLHWARYPSRYFPETGVRLFDLGRVEELPRPVRRRVPPTTGCLTDAG